MKRNFHTLILLFIASWASAQWTLNNTNLPQRNVVNYIHAVDSMTVFGTVRDTSATVSVLKYVKSLDGGATWTIGNITGAAGLTSASIWAIDATKVFIPMYNGTAGGGKLMKSTNGGTSWTNALAGITGAFSAPDGFPDFVCFTNATTGIALGDPNGGYFEIYRTTDAGTTWARVPQASIPAHLTGEYGLTDIYDVNGNSIWFGTNFGRVYHSGDAGLTWTVTATPYNVGSEYISGLAFQDENIGYAFTDGSSTAAHATDDLVKTTDGGATWTTVPSNVGTAARGDMTYVPGTTNSYFLSTVQACFYSVDGCATWYPATEAGGNDNINKMSFPDKTHGFGAANYFTGPIAVWAGAVAAPQCVTILGPSMTARTAMCSGDSITFWVRINNATDPNNKIGVILSAQGDNGVWGAPNTIADITTVAGVTPVFTPDAGSTTVGTLAVSVSLSNLINATTGAFDEIKKFKWQFIPTSCVGDTSIATYVQVYLAIADDATATPPYVGCAATVLNGNTISVDYSACSGTTPRVTYTVLGYSVDGAAVVAGSSYTATAGTHTVQFGIDNGVCVQVVSGNITFVGTNGAKDDTAIQAFPNPTTDRINFTANNQAVSAEIYDVNGKLVSMQSVVNSGNVTTIMTNNLAPGMYFVQTVAANGTRSQRFRFVKQ